MSTVPGATGAITPPEGSEELHAYLSGLADSGRAATPSSITIECGDVVARCMDGRPALHDEPIPLAPRAAGGSLIWWEAVALSGAAIEGIPVNQYNEPRMPVHTVETAAWMESVFWWMDEHGLMVSDHWDDHSHGPAAGCAAADALHAILGRVAEFPPALSSILETWGIDPSLIDEGVRARALALAEQIPDGRDIVGAIDAHAPGDAPLPTLTGAHREAAVVVNLREGTTLDADALRAAFGDGTQLFWVDLWSFRRMAETIVADGMDDGPAVETVIAAAAVANASALTLLSGEGMPFITIV